MKYGKSELSVSASFEGFQDNLTLATANYEIVRAPSDFAKSVLSFLKKFKLKFMTNIYCEPRLSQKSLFFDQLYQVFN